MILDARKGDYRTWRSWRVYHAEECRMLKNVVWVDSDTAQWGESPQLFTVVDGEPVIHIHQARKIEIYVDRQLVIINPVPDEITIKEKELEAQ